MRLTCSKCYGNKTYRGMGSMIIKCEPCNGTGFIEVTAERPKSVEVTLETAPKEKSNAKQKSTKPKGTGQEKAS